MNFLNRCRWRATTNGTGPWVVASAITGYLVPEDCADPSVVDNGDYHAIIASDDLSQWNIVDGVYTVADDTFTVTLTHDTSAGFTSFSAAPIVILGPPLANDWPFSGTAIPENSIVITGGVGATDGSAVTITAGGGTAAAGGVASIAGGLGATVGGNVIVAGGEGSSDEGGHALIYGGMGTAGGGVDIGGGEGTAAGGGGINAQGGQGASGFDGGAVEFAGGDGDNGGAVNLRGGVGNSGNGGGVTFEPGGGTVNGGDVTITLPTAGSGRQGLIIISGLPTSDPSVTGALWSNGGVLTVS